MPDRTARLLWALRQSVERRGVPLLMIAIVVGLMGGVLRAVSAGLMTSTAARPASGPQATLIAPFSAGYAAWICGSAVNQR